MKKIILASSSIYRQAMLARLKIPFDSTSPKIDETAKLNELPENLVKRLSIAKAKKVSEDNKEAFIIGSDQVAVFNEQIIGKPITHQKAFEQLQKFSGQQIRFITGVALTCYSQNICLYEDSEVIVKFKTFSNTKIENYLLQDKPYDCAGSFKVESLGITLFESVQSNDPTSLEGLPLIIVCKMLNQCGFTDI